MKILTTEDIRTLRMRTAEAEGLTGSDLVHIAAESIRDEITKRWPASTRIEVFAGWGNNGAKALDTAILLAAAGYTVEIYLFNIGGNRLCPEARVCRDRIVESGLENITLYEITGAQRFTMPEPDPDCVIIDGLFGNGLERGLPNSFRILADNLNRSGAPIVSIELPSGLFGEWNANNPTSNVVHASLTLTTSTPRISFLMADYAPVVGEWRVIDGGLNEMLLRETPFTYYLIERSAVRHYLPRRDPFATKAAFGDGLICAGSRGMMGAAVLAAQGALRAGVGKLTVRSASCGTDVLQTAVPCAMFSGDSNHSHITNLDNLDRYNAVAIGPGIGTNIATIDALESFLKHKQSASTPVVLDADALNCIATRPRLLDYLPVLSVLTPHAGEFDRIFGPQPNAEARLRKAIEVAHYYQIIIVLKGHYTATVRPDERVFFNSTGTPAMATPGSGDVLTGIILALMAQGIAPEKASFCATYVHGLAGEIAARRHGDYGVTAADIAECVGQAIREIYETK